MRPITKPSGSEGGARFMMFWMAYGSADGNPQEMLPLGALLLRR